MSSIDKNNPRQPFEQIADFYRAEIHAQRLRPGDKLPPVRDIADQFHVANGTVNSAIKALKDAGLVMSWQGRGIFVRDNAADAMTDDLLMAQQLHTVLEKLDSLDQRVTALEARRARGAGDAPKR